MAPDVRKWLPPALIGLAYVATALAVRDLPATVPIDLRGLLPFQLESSADTAPRWVLIVLLPGLAAVIWALLQLLRGHVGAKLTRALFGDVPEAAADPMAIEHNRATYDAIGLWVVVLILGVHAGMVAAALGHERLAPRLTTVILGISLVAAGNVMPRLRPNLVAGVRTRRTLRDPQLWRTTHRILGAGLVVAGTLTVIVGLVAPAYGLITAIVALMLAFAVTAAVTRNPARIPGDPRATDQPRGPES